MTRTATGAELALLDALEPQAKIGWEAELLNIREAIALSQAITDRRLALATETQALDSTSTKQAAIDLNTITVRSLPAETQGTLPTGIRGTYDPDYVEP